MREKIVAGNWKMNLTALEVEKLISEVSDFKIEGVNQIIFPTYLYLEKAVKSFRKGLVLGIIFSPLSNASASGIFEGFSIDINPRLASIIFERKCLNCINPPFIYLYPVKFR